MQAQARGSRERCSWRWRRAHDVPRGPAAREPRAESHAAPQASSTVPPAPPPSPASIGYARTQLQERVFGALEAGRTAEARAVLIQLAAQFPALADAHFMLGAMCSADGAHADAEAHYRRALAADDAHVGARCNLGQALLARGEAAEAVGHLRSAGELPQARINLCLALRALGDDAGALGAARDAARLAPQSARALLLLGECRLDAADPADALVCARGAMAAAEAAAARERPVGGPTASGVVTEDAARACTLAGRALEATGAYDEALAAYSRAVALCPDLPAAASLRGALASRALRERLSAIDGDIFITSYPKSGTTWMQQIACMLCGEPADVHIQSRAPWAEAGLATGALSLSELGSAAARPRIFKTHAAWGALPVAGCGDAPPRGVRVIVVVRDPRDVMVSLYYHSRAIRAISYAGTAPRPSAPLPPGLGARSRRDLAGSWDEWHDLWMRGEAPLPMGGDGVDWFEHTRGWRDVALRCPRQVLWVAYESLLRDAVAEVRRVGEFLGVPVSESRVREIATASGFAQMKARHDASDGLAGAHLRHAGEAGHFRRGEAGGWRLHFSRAQTVAFARAARERLRGSGLGELYGDEVPQSRE